MLDIDSKNLYISTVCNKVLEITKIKKCGIEVAYFSYAENMDRYLADTKKDIEKCLSVTDNLIFHAPFYEISMAAIDSKAKEFSFARLNQFYDLVKDYNPRKMVLHTGYIPSIYYPAWFIPHATEFLNDYIKGKNIEVCVENVLGNDPSYLYDIFKNIKSDKVKICLDIGHVNVYSKKIDGKESTTLVKYWIDKLSPYITHYHIHNNNGDKDRHLDIDKGNMDINEIIRYAKSKNNNATFTLEIIDIGGKV